MAAIWKFLFSFAAGSLISIFKMIVATAIGIVFNWTFLIFAGLSASAIWQAERSVQSSKAELTIGGVSSTTLTLIILGIGFPLLYFVVGQNIGLQASLKHIYKHNKEKFFDFLFILLSKLKKEKAEADQSISQEEASRLLKTIEGMPWP